METTKINVNQSENLEKDPIYFKDIPIGTVFRLIGYSSNTAYQKVSNNHYTCLNNSSLQNDSSGVKNEPLQIAKEININIIW